MQGLPDEDSIDLDALQAQIDLSLAYTKNLVSSWLQPISGSKASLPEKDGRSKEFEAMLRKPPRLGVGATAPAPGNPLTVEAAKLKAKLSGKKRGKEAANNSILLASSYGSEEADESRGRAIVGKAKHDPFGPAPRKKSKPMKGDGHVLAHFSKRESPNDQVSHPGKQGSVQHSLCSDRPSLSSGGPPVNLVPNNEGLGDSLESLGSHPEESQSDSVEKSKVLSFHLQHPHQSAPLLNLDGPPPADVGPALPKKKRKRRKKKVALDP